MILATLMAVAALHGGAPYRGPGDAVPPPPQEEEVDAEPIAATTVGMRVRLDELVIRGPQLRAKPVADPGRADAIVRVVHVYPHGSDWRYDLEVTAFEPGTIDLRDHLETLDGGPGDGGPVGDDRPLLVEVGAVLPAGVLEPNELDIPAPRDVGGYRLRMILLGALWFAVLVALFFVGRRKRAEHAAAADAPPPTLADRLRPLVEEARTGELSTGRRAELERLLLAHWRERRDLGGVQVAEAVSRLRTDDEAGPLFRQLEEWLHRPGTNDADVDVAALLEPYRKAPDPALVGAGR